MKIARTKLDMYAKMNVPFGYKEWLRGPTPALSYLVRFRAGCPPIGEELTRRAAQTEDDGSEESGMCPTCAIDTLETRGHFLVDCSTYSEARKGMMSACKGVISQESWTTSLSFSSEKRALWLLSGCPDVSSEGEPQQSVSSTRLRCESVCCNAVGTFLETAMKKRFTIAKGDSTALMDLTSPFLSRGSVSDFDSSDDDSPLRGRRVRSDSDSSDDDVPLRTTLIRSEPRLARSMASAATSDT